MKKLIILRGLPGSGKSRVAAELGGVVCSADHFFMVDGEYKFDPYKLGEAHADCQRSALRAMAGGESTVVIDNTNSRKWEYLLYLEMGQAFGYDIKVNTVGGRSYEDVRTYFRRNIHGVPEDRILQMAYRWEE